MASKILLLNAGSSSLKYQLIDADTEEVLGSGICEKITLDMGSITHKVNGEKFPVELPLPDHKVALKAVLDLFTEHGPSLDGVIAVGHRTVHGGTKFREPVQINAEVIETLRTLIPLAPLHNPAGISGIEAAMEILPDVPHVGIFDTAFFSSLPAEAYTYAIPADLAEKHSIRRYGFHGTSHDFVSHEVATFLGKPYEEVNQIVCHIGNGASISAIKGGQPVDTSMGMTPVEGLVMGTRSGDVDPGLFLFLAHQEGLSTAEIDQLLNKKSGVVGLCGLTDMRDVENAVNAGEPVATLASTIYSRRIAKYIGAYAMLLGGRLDAITFTAGVGENDHTIRKATCDYLSILGVELDEEKNKVRSGEPREISTPASKVKVLVIPTNEELSMARQTLKVVKG